MRLYYSPGACSMAPHIVLEEIGAPYDSERVLLAKGAHMTPGYAEVNRWRRVPVLETEGERLTEAGPIMIYLADDAPAANLLPPVGSMARARALEYASWLASSVHIAFATIWRPQIFTGRRCRRSRAEANRRGNRARLLRRHRPAHEP